MNQVQKIGPKEIRFELARRAILSLSPDILDVLLRQSDFTEQYSIPVATEIAFHNIDEKFEQNLICDGARKIYAGSKTVSIKDTKGNSWTLTMEKSLNKQSPYKPLFLNDENDAIIHLQNHELLSPNLKDRKNYFERITKENFYSQSFYKKWFEILKTRPLSNSEFYQYFREVRISPNYFLESNKDSFRMGLIDVTKMVPKSFTHEYFELLVGKYDNSKTISDYAKIGAKKHIEALLDWHPIEGIRQSLLLSIHSTISAQIDARHLTLSEMTELLESIIASGNSLLQFGAIQLGLDYMKAQPNIEPQLVELINQLKDDDVESKSSKLRLLNILYILVEGELARTRCLAKFPPFYRRLASFAHAGLLQQSLFDLNLDLDKFSKWSMEGRGKFFYFQTFSDIQFDSRWNPDFTTALVLKDYYINRILNKFRLIENQKTNNLSSELKTLISSESEPSLLSTRRLPYVLFSGPVDGSEFSSKKIPNEVKEEIESGISNKKIDLNIVKVFITWIMKFDNSQVFKCVVEFLIQNFKFPLVNVKTEIEIFDVLNDLSIIAAVTKSESLSMHIKSICQRYRNRGDESLASLSEFQCCLTSSNAYKSNEERRKFVQDWLIELSYKKDDNAKISLLSGIQHLCHVEPEFWKYCNQAEAAISSVAKIKW